MNKRNLSIINRQMAVVELDAGLGGWLVVLVRGHLFEIISIIRPGIRWKKRGFNKNRWNRSKMGHTYN